MGSTDNKELLRYLGAYCDVNALGPDWEGKLRRDLENSKIPEVSIQFKQQLLRAIRLNTVSNAEIEFATSWDFDTEEEKRGWLVDLWTKLYDSDPLKVDIDSVMSE